MHTHVEACAHMVVDLCVHARARMRNSTQKFSNQNSNIITPKLS